MVKAQESDTWTQQRIMIFLWKALIALEVLQIYV